MNYGVILGQRPEDYIAGANSPIPYEIRGDGDWKPYCPPGEWQRNKKTDFMACVTFSALNSIETQEFFLTGKNVNYSDRWIAKLSGTTKDGNYLYKVTDAIRKYGLVLEEDYPSGELTWDEYYKEIPADSPLFAKGQEWLKKWEVRYEWLDPKDWNLDYHLKHAPIQLALYTPSHAVVDVYSPSGSQDYFDSYEPWFKTTPLSNVAAAMKIVLTKRNMTNSKLIKIGNELGYWFPAISGDGLKSQAANVGEVLPEKADGTLDFDKITPDYTI